jgi:DNA-binding CsgD family transcriptional regulator
MTSKFFSSHYLGVTQAHTTSQFREQIVRFTESLGYKTVSAMAIIDHVQGESEFHVVDNIPASFSLSYNDTRLAKIDPVMQHCKLLSTPLVWDQRTYTAKGFGEMWEHQAGHGFKRGIAVAAHFPGGRHFFMGIDSDCPRAPKDHAIANTVSELERFLFHAEEAAFRILAPPTTSQSPPDLSPCELEALRWTMDGKTTWEIGEIMNLPERDIFHHLQNALERLGCISKYQAVLKAIRLRLLV